MSEDFENENYDNSLDAFKTYEDYLDKQITEEDKFYLEDIELARQLKEEGYHVKTEILTRELFEAKKRAIEEAKQNQHKDKTKALASTLVSLRPCPFLRALAEREEKVLNGRMLTIIFMRVIRVEEGKQKLEISGYIDYAHRLKSEDFRQYFEGTKMLIPKQTDLSYYNWKTGFCSSNDSPNFKVDTNIGHTYGSKEKGDESKKELTVGLQFRNKRDRKTIDVNLSLKEEEENVKRIEINDALREEGAERYWQPVQVVLYDHETRRKN